MSLYARLRVISKAFSDDNRGSIPTEGVQIGRAHV